MRSKCPHSLKWICALTHEILELRTLSLGCTAQYRQKSGFWNQPDLGSNPSFGIWELCEIRLIMDLLEAQALLPVE